MPRVIFAPAALRDLQRLRAFLRPKNPSAARRVGEAILQGVQGLGVHPRMGRPIEDLPEQYREWVIAFGDSGYVARYRIDADIVTILAIRHQKESGFR
jgi:plasmid stabilization system protein ParE